MPEKERKNKWRLVLTVLTVGALLVLILALHKQIGSTISNFHKVDLWVLALLLPIEFANYFAQAKLYEDSLKTLGHKLDLKFLFKFSLETNLIATVFPSGGLSAISYSNLRLKKKGLSTANATLVQLLKTVIVFSSFLIILIFGLFLLALDGRANGFLLLVSGIITTTLVVLTLVGLYIIGDIDRINTFFTFFTRVINRFIRIFRPRIRETIKIRRVRITFRELHESYMIFRDNLGQLKWPMIWAIVANLTEVAALYAVYVAFGHWVNPGGIILAYAVANFASVFSILPGGVGAYETIMTLVLAAAGISPSLSIPITIMYRVVNTLIQIVPGYIYYQKAISPEKITADATG